MEIVWRNTVERISFRFFHEFYADILLFFIPTKSSVFLQRADGNATSVLTDSFFLLYNLTHLKILKVC